MTARRPRLRDISELAGVSKATVDRVINNRPGVQEHTRRHVFTVMAELTGDAPPDKAGTRLDFVIPASENAFMDQLVNRLTGSAARRGGIDIRCHRLPGIAPEYAVETLNGLADKGRAIGLIALDHQRIRQTLQTLNDRGVGVATIASDISHVPRVAYVGIDNRAAGRLVGHLTGRMVPGGAGKVALILGARAYHGHQEREIGFRSVLRERFSELRIVDEREIHEDIDAAYREAMAVLELHDDLSAIYCIGAGQPGVARALVERGRADSVIFAGHGLTTDTRDFLIDGVMDFVIDEDTHLIADRAIDCLLSATRGGNPPAFAPIRIHAIFPENIPVVP